MTFHIALLGASKGIGARVLHTLLSETSATCSLLLRNPAVFDADDLVTPAIKDGKVRIVQGDATNQGDVERLLEGHVDVVLTSVGGAPSLTLRGFQIDQPTLCTDAALALLRVLDKRPIERRPRVIVVSSMGTGPEHGIMPLPLRILYPWMLSGPHADKEGLEYLFQRAGNFPTPTQTPPTSILSEADRASLPESFVPEVIIIRPALLTDGAESGLSKIRAAEGASVWTISRNDVARFITDRCMPGEGEWVNRAPVLGY